MILTCPECDTQYFADDATIGDSGRTVKCAACGHSWFVPGRAGQASDSNADNDEAEVKAAMGAHEAYRQSVREKRRKKSRFAAVMSWGISAGIFFSSALEQFSCAMTLLKFGHNRHPRTR